MAIIKLSPTERRRLSAFVTCLVLAVLAWLLSTLQGIYSYKVQRLLVYTNAPQKRAFRSLQSDTVDVTMQGSGWKMLFAKMQPTGERVSADLHTLDTKNFVALNTQLDRINLHKEADQKIIDFDPDTLYFDFTNRAIKRVPVKLQYRMQFMPQFAMAGNITIRPSYVTLSGPANVIDKITEWKSDSLKMGDVSENTTSKVNLERVHNANLTIYPKAVQVTVPVEEYTEKTVEVPVKLVGNVHFYEVKIFPQKVKVTFTTSLSRYNELDEDFFDATANLTLWSDRHYKALPVKLTRMPAFSKIVKIEPQNVDFIIEK